VDSEQDQSTGTRRKEHSGELYDPGLYRPYSGPGWYVITLKRVLSWSVRLERLYQPGYPHGGRLEREVGERGEEEC